MILFLGHGPRPRTNPNAAGGVALGWVPLDFIFALCLPFFFVEYTSLGFGYVWIQYLIDFGKKTSKVPKLVEFCWVVWLEYIESMLCLVVTIVWAEKDAARTRHKKGKKLWIVIT